MSFAASLPPILQPRVAAALRGGAAAARAPSRRGWARIPERRAWKAQNYVTTYTYGAAAACARGGCAATLSRRARVRRASIELCAVSSAARAWQLQCFRRCVLPQTRLQDTICWAAGRACRVAAREAARELSSLQRRRRRTRVRHVRPEGGHFASARACCLRA